MNAVTRCRAAAALLIAWLPLSLVWAIVWPDNPEDTKAVFASAAAHQSAWELAASVFAIAFLIAVPGLVATMRFVDGRRGSRLLFAGALLAAAGFVADVVAGTSSVMMSLLAGEPNRAQMIDLWNSYGTRPVSIVFVVLILLGHLGLVLLGSGMRRAQLVGLWVPLTIAAGMVVETAIGTASHASVATVALTGAGLVGIARALLTTRESSAAPAWEPTRAPAVATV